MEKFIEVYDNIIPIELVNDIENKVLYKTEYSYLFNITHPSFSTDYHPGFSSSFINFEDRLYKDTQFFLNQILYRLCHHKNINLQQVLNGRCFLHVPTSSISLPQNIHTDLNFPHWVCLYYVTDSDGDTIFFDDNENEIKRVSPKKGRIAFFDGTINHCSSNPTKLHRSVINFDFIGKYLDK